MLLVYNDAGFVLLQDITMLNSVVQMWRVAREAGEAASHDPRRGLTRDELLEQLSDEDKKDLEVSIPRPTTYYVARTHTSMLLATPFRVEPRLFAGAPLASDRCSFS